MPEVPQQRGSAPASCVGLQSGQLHADAGIAEGGGARVPDELAAAIGQNRRRTGEACARYYWLLLAEGHLTRQRFGSMLRMIVALPLPDG